MRWLSLVLGIIFSAAGLKALFAFDPSTSAVSRPVLLAISAAGSVLFIFLFASASRTQQELSEFERWLREHAAEILANGTVYNGIRITGDTEMTRFLLTISIVFLTFKIPSRYYVSGRDSVAFTQAAYSLATLLLGWWGIPWGPIYTVQALAKNLSGGYKTTVREYLALGQGMRQ
jgi:hypothetical protein